MFSRADMARSEEWEEKEQEQGEKGVRNTIKQTHTHKHCMLIVFIRGIYEE